MTRDESAYYVGAVFPDAATAEAVVTDLHELGVSEEHLGLIVRDPHDRHGLGEEIDHETGEALTKGIAAGVPVGMLATMGVVAVALPGGVIGLGGALAGAAAAGVAGGAYFGGLFGLAADRALTAEEEWEDIPISGDEVLIAAHPDEERREEQIRAVFDRHGGRPVAP